MKLICLRLWFPHVYGWYLIFQNNVPVCCISPEIFESLKYFIEYPSTEQNFIQLNKILNQQDLYGAELIEVDPSKSNILEDKVASCFIPAFYNYFGEIFREGSPFIDSDADFLPVLQKYFPTVSSVVSLDVGAGSGKYAKALRNSVSNIIACDIATERLKTLVDDSDIQIVGCDIQNLPFGCCFFGFAMCNFVLEHVANPYRVLSEIIRVLDHQGTFLLSFPSFCYSDIYGSKVLKETPSLNFEHLRSFTAETGVHPWEEETSKLIKYLEENLCEIIEIRGINITTRLEPSSLNFIYPYLDIPEIGSTNQYPWNLYGQQTVIFGRKK